MEQRAGKATAAAAGGDIEAYAPARAAEQLGNHARRALKRLRRAGDRRPQSISTHRRDDPPLLHTRRASARLRQHVGQRLAWTVAFQKHPFSGRQSGHRGPW